jgi:putative spermidine/putrescine transport system permease protein
MTAASLERSIGPKYTLAGIAASVVAWVVYLFLVSPNLIVVPMSFGNRQAFEFPPKSLSFFLYEKFFTDAHWVSATLLSFRVAIGATCLALLLGVPAAYSLVRGSYPGKRIITGFLLSPILVPVVVIALGLYFHFAAIGIVGTEGGLILAHTAYTMPFVIVTCIAGLRHVDPTLEVVATIMGAGRLLTFWRVTLPLLRPAMLVGGLFAFLMSFDEVVIAFFIVHATTFTLPVKMYSSIQFDLSPVLAAVSSLLTLLSLGVCLAGAYLQRK